MRRARLLEQRVAVRADTRLHARCAGAEASRLGTLVVVLPRVHLRVL